MSLNLITILWKLSVEFGSDVIGQKVVVCVRHFSKGISQRIHVQDMPKMFQSLDTIEAGVRKRLV